MKKIILVLIVVNLISLSLFSSILYKNEKIYEIEKEIEKINTETEVLENEKSNLNTIAINKNKVIEDMLIYKKNNINVPYIEDAVNEILSYKFIILNNAFVSMGFEKSKVNKELNKYIINKDLESTYIYDADLYNDNVEKIIAVVKKNNTAEYIKTKKEINKNISIRIKASIKKLKAVFDKTQDYKLILKIQELQNISEKLSSTEYANSYIKDKIKIKYFAINALISILSMILYVKIYKIIIMEKREKNKRRTQRRYNRSCPVVVSQRKLARIEEKNKKQIKLRIAFSIAMIVISNAICILSITK